jgi:response regulator RpfG family c-di-GMP phosphodiesterase
MFKRRIVILDEQPGLISALSEKLSASASIQLECFDSVTSCLKSTPKSPHLIFVEHKMNHIDGVSAIKILRKKWRRTTIVLKGVSEEGCRKINKRRYRINKVLSHPINIDEFIHEIQQNRRRSILKWSMCAVALSACCLFLFIK